MGDRRTIPFQPELTLDVALAKVLRKSNLSLDKLVIKSKKGSIPPKTPMQEIYDGVITLKVKGTLSTHDCHLTD